MSPLKSPASGAPTAAADKPQSLTDAWVALTGLSAVFLFEMLDNSILNVALPAIGRDLHATTAQLQWVTGTYSVIFGGTMLVFSAMADRFGRRRVMLSGLVLLVAASLATAAVSSPWQLIAVRAGMGLAAAMTTPLSMALSFRLFDDDSLRVRALTVISTVGLVGMAIGPVAGGLLLAVAPWQVLLLINVPVGILAYVGIRAGIAPDTAVDLHPAPIDGLGAALGTTSIVAALVAPTLFAEGGAGAWQPWACSGEAVALLVAFIVRQRTAAEPLIDLRLVAAPLVSSGLAYKAATGIATAGTGYLVTLSVPARVGVVGLAGRGRHVAAGGHRSRRGGGGRHHRAGLGRRAGGAVQPRRSNRWLGAHPLRRGPSAVGLPAGTAKAALAAPVESGRGGKRRQKPRKNHRAFGQPKGGGGGLGGRLG